jgi:hypothetical protein
MLRPERHAGGLARRGGLTAAGSNLRDLVKLRDEDGGHTLASAMQADGDGRSYRMRGQAGPTDLLVVAARRAGQGRVRPVDLLAVAAAERQ